MWDLIVRIRWYACCLPRRLYSDLTSSSVKPEDSWYCISATTYTYLPAAFSSASGESGCIWLASCNATWCSSPGTELVRLVRPRLRLLGLRRMVSEPCSVGPLYRYAKMLTRPLVNYNISYFCKCEMLLMKGSCEKDSKVCTYLENVIIVNVIGMKITFVGVRIWNWGGVIGIKLLLKIYWKYQIFLLDVLIQLPLCVSSLYIASKIQFISSFCKNKSTLVVWLTESWLYKCNTDNEIEKGTRDVILCIRIERYGLSVHCTIHTYNVYTIYLLVPTQCSDIYIIKGYNV